MTSIFLFSVLRSFLIALFTTLIATHLIKVYLSSNKKNRQFILLAMLLPLLTPPLLPAYAYSSFKINFQTSPFINEITYIIITATRFLPYAVLTLFMLNYSSDFSSNACDRLSPGKKISLLRKHSTPIVAFILPFLLCLHEYETASLMRIKHWSIEVFNAHSGGLSQTMWSSFKMILSPLSISVIAIIFALNLMKFNPLKVSQNSPTQNTKATLIKLTVIIFLSISFLLPLLIICYSGVSAFSEIFSTGWMLKETLNSALFAVVATVCLTFISPFLVNSSKKLVTLALIPGLCGNLILGLVTLNIFQLPGINSLNHSVLPLTIAFILYGLPLSLLLNFCFSLKYKDSSIKTAELLPEAEKRKIFWKLKTQPFIFCQFPVFCLLWFDLTLSTLLAPTSMPGIFPRLYNLMHYNENEKLSATVVVAVLIPPIILALTLMISRIGAKWTQGRFSGN